MTYPQEALEVDAAGIQSAVEVVNGILDRVVLRHQIDESRPSARGSHTTEAFLCAVRSTTVVSMCCCIGGAAS